VRHHADTDPDPDPDPNPNPDGTDGAENNLPELPFGQELRGELHQQQMDRA
jgi:hypothetical protein